MAGKIFISYRRDDSADQVHGIAQYLERAFGRRHVFVDVDMRAGTNFPQELEKRLAECRVLLALIGPGWLNAQDEEGRRRLDNPEDWVRLEIGRALQRRIVVIPVSVGGAELPKTAALPDDIKGLLNHQAAIVTTRTFRNDMAGLSKDITASRGRTRNWWSVAIGASALLLGLGASYGAWILGALPQPSTSSPDTASTQKAAVASPPLRPSDVLARCVKDQPHPDGTEIIGDLTKRFEGQKFKYGWVPEAPVTPEKSGPVWHDIIEAAPAEGALQLKFPWRNGRLRLVPVVQRRFSTRSASVSLMLQGMWSQDNGYGCIELTFDNNGEARGGIGVMDASRLDTQAFIRRVN